MTVLILCTSLPKGLNVVHEIEKLSEVRSEVLVFRSPNKGALYGLCQICYHYLRLNPARMLHAVKLCMQGRLRITCADLHAAATLAWLGRRRFDVGLHAAGVIYRKSLLDCFKLGVLNAHIGLLPRYRGRCVMEWSVLDGAATGITTFFMDEGIDTGPNIVLREEVSISHFDNVEAAKAFLFSLDATMYKRALGLLNRPDFRYLQQRKSEGTRYYVMSALLQSVVEQRLRHSTQ